MTGLIFKLLLLSVEVGEFLLVTVPNGDARSLHRWRQDFILNCEGLWREEGIFRLKGNTIIEVRKILMAAHVAFDRSTRNCHAKIDLFIISLHNVLKKNVTRINSVNLFR